MKKPIIASLIALLMTACVGTSIFVIGGAALLNKNGVAPSSSQAQLSQVSNVSAVNQTQIDQMQGLINQYQDREKQYQQREQQLQDQLAQANAQVQQDQEMVQQIRSLLAALQQRGLITVTNDGRILINR